MTRTILIHLHVEASDADTRSEDEIADAVGEALEEARSVQHLEAIDVIRAGGEDDRTSGLMGLTFAVPLVEELEAR